MSENLQVPPATASDVQEASGSMPVLQIVWRRKALVLLALVVSLVIGSLYYAQATPIYRSTAQVLVVKKHPDAVTGMNTIQLHQEDYVATHQVLIQSPEIVNRAIRKRHLETLKSLAGEKGELAEAIIYGLTVTRNKTTGTNNNILELAYRCKVPSEAGTVLAAVIESYKDFLDETYRTMTDDTLELVSKGRDVLQKDLAEKEAAYREFRQKTPVVSKGKEGANLQQERLASIEAKRSALMLQRADIQGQLSALEAAQKEGRNHEILLAMVNDWAGKDGEGVKPKNEAGMDGQFLALLAEEQKLTERFGPNHPEVRSIRQRIATARDFLANPAAAYAAEPEDKTRRAGKTDPVQLYLETLKKRLDKIKISEQLLAELFQQEHDEARKLTSYEIQDEAFRADIARMQQLYDGIIKRLQDVSLVKDMGGFDARTIAPPTAARKITPRILFVFPTAALLGILFGLGLAYLAETTDQSFRTPEEIRRRLGLPVVGYVPVCSPAREALEHVEEGGKVLDPMLCTFYRPKSLDAEAIRGIRTALYFNTGGEGHKVIQVTSPSVGDGKSTVAANLAVSIAQSGKRIVLVDADLRKPRVHSIFGLSADVGMASVISGDVELEDAIQESGIPELAILPCGPLPPNPAELLTSPRFKNLLDVLRERFEFVIVDTPPLLAVTDPGVVAPRVDGVVLTVRITKNGRPLAERAKETLATLGANVLGVVVNGVERGGKRGGYGYGYGYGNYGYASAEGYHSETVAGGVSPTPSQGLSPHLTGSEHEPRS